MADGIAPAEDNGQDVEIHLGSCGKGGGRFLTMKENVRQRQNTVAHYIATQSLLELCEGSERAPGARVGMRWWE